MATRNRNRPSASDVTPITTKQPAAQESKEISGVAKAYMQTVIERQQRESEEVVRLIAAEMGLKFEDGWRFNPQTGAFVREVPDTPAAQ